MKKYNIALVGATGLVGSTILQILTEKQHIPIENLYLFASPKSVGKIISFRKKNWTVEELSEQNISDKKIDFALLATSTSISLKFAPIFKKYGAIVIDNSSAWRMGKDIPLVVPQVNPKACLEHKGIIANPNCSTIQCIAPLKALHYLFKLTEVKYATYQSVSGSGAKGLADLENNMQGLPPKFYPHPIYNNCLPHIDQFLPNGYTKEEMKMIKETRKILELPKLKVTATCVRVPIRNCHCVEIYAQFKHRLDLPSVYFALNNFDSIIVVDEPEKNLYPLPTTAEGKDQIFVGRIRIDINNPKALHMFSVADNIRKGAASNAVEIMELLIASKQ